MIALLAGAGLRWLGLGWRSFWYDESFSGLTARLNLPQILTNAALDVHPPGYYVLLHFWAQLGSSDAFLRSFSVLFSLGAILLMYGLGRRFFGEAVAALAALGLALAPFQVYFAQEARMYSLVVFLTVALTWLFLEGVVSARGWWFWLGFAITATLGLYVHYFVVFLLLGLYLWLAFDLPRLRLVWPRLVGANAVVVALFLPQMQQALVRTGAYLGLEAWQPVPNILSPLTAMYYLLFAHRSPVWIAPVGLFLTLAVLVLIAWENRRRAKPLRRLEGALWCSVLAPIMTVTIISSLSAHSIYVERSFAVASPALLLLLAVGAVYAPRRSPTPYLVLLLAAPISVTLAAHSFTPDPAKPPVREAALMVAQNFAAGDVSLHLQDASALPALWSTPGVSSQLADVPQAAFIFPATHRLFGGDVAEWQTALSGATRLWLTVMPGYTGPDQKAVLRQIDATYPRLQGWDWGQVQLYLYNLPQKDGD
jgi:mannosyltransferase